MIMVSLCGCCGYVEMSPTGNFSAVLHWSRVEFGFSGSDKKKQLFLLSNGKVILCG